MLRFDEPFLLDGELMKKTLANINNSRPHIVNSMNNLDILENDFKSMSKIKKTDKDTISETSMGSHRNRKMRSNSDSHRGSSDSLDDGEEKKDASKEDLDDGTFW